MNDAVENGWMEYDRLVKFDKDSDGRVTALSSNMAEFNRLQTAVADDVLARLSQVSASELAVPLGTLTGSPLLAGRGPKLTVKWRPSARLPPNSGINSRRRASTRQSTRSCWM